MLNHVAKITHGRLDRLVDSRVDTRMKRTDLPINAPCSKDWDTMTPAGLKRFCSDCKKHVHDMASMTRAQAGAFLSEHAGEHACVRYAVDDAGALLFAPRELINATSLLPSVRALAAATAMVAGVYAYQHAMAPRLKVAAVSEADPVVEHHVPRMPVPLSPDPWATRSVPLADEPSMRITVTTGAISIPETYKSESPDTDAQPRQKPRKSGKPKK